MADNTTLNTGSGGDVIGSDDISGVKYQRVKLIHGADGVNDGDVASANPLPVDGSGVTQPVSGTVTANAGTGTFTVDNGGTFAVQSTLQANSGVDIGDVDVTSIVPGTGATNLGKAEDAAHTTGDVGVMALGVRQDSALNGALSDTDGDYEPFHMDGSRLLVAPGVVQLIDAFSDHTSWAAVDDNAGNLASDGTNYLTPNSSTSFDKLDGTANTVYGLISKTIGTPLNILNGLTGAAFFQVVMNIPDLTNVANVIFRAGTDASNYGEWAVDPTNATAGDWSVFRFPVTSQRSATGTGWGATAVDYFAVGLEFNAESDTLASILVDAIIYNGAQLVESSLSDAGGGGGVDIVNVQKIGNQVVTTNTGNAGNGTQRVVLASDQPAVTVDGSGVTQPVSGTVTANAGTGTFTVDGSAVTQPISASSLPLPTGAATAANQLPDGHNVTVDNAAGAAAVNIQDGGNSITVDNAGTFAVQATLQASTNTQEVVGDAAHDAAVAGNPLLMGVEARTTVPTAVGNGDVVRLQADDQGRLITSPLSPRDLVTHNQITLTNTTETTLIAAGGAGVLRDIVTLAASNTSSTAVRVDIRDSTTGTVRWSQYLAADGGGFVLNLPVPLTQATANNNWTAQLSGSVTDVRVMAIAVDRA